MPTFSRLAGGCAVADTRAAKTGLATSPVLAVASVAGISEVPHREQLAPISKLKKKASNTEPCAIQFGALAILRVLMPTTEKEIENTLTQ